MLVVPLLTLLAACPAPSDGTGTDTESVSSAALDSVLLHISYEPDAEPYTGSGPLGNETWSLFETNMAALFEGTGVTVDNPRELDEMQALDDLAQEEFTVAELLDLDEQHRRDGGDEQTLVLHAIFVDGYFADEDGRREGVIGVSIGNTGVIAMFKPVISSLGLTETTRRFGEQTTLIHEVGHAVGLVNNGVDMQSPHQDEENGAHCDDDACVMYWANEGSSELAEFVGRYVLDGETVLFDDDCLADVQAGY